MKTIGAILFFLLNSFFLSAQDSSLPKTSVAYKTSDSALQELYNRAEALAAENITDYLELQGHVMDYAMDGIGGLHLALTQEYDAIILDVMLPVIDGLRFCKKLR